MSLTLISTPEKTVNGILSNVVAGRSQVPFEFLTTDQAQDNFKVLIDVLDSNDVAFFTITFKFSPKPDGSLFIDLGRIVTEISEARGALETRFKLTYSSEWDGGSTAPVTIGPFLAVYGEKQLLSEGGANMFEHLLKDSSSKFATVFKNPCFWPGFNRTLSVIVDDNFTARTGLTKYRTENKFLDINGNTIETFFGKFVDFTETRVDLLSLINSDTHAVKVSIENISEEITYKKREVCDNPIMVDWLNSKGGVDQWLFEIDQLFEKDALPGLRFENAITEDISTVRRTKGRISPKWIQQIILKAENLTLDQLKALEEIKSSVSVRIWLNNSGSEWVGVVVSAKFQSMHNSIDQLHELTLQLELPDNFDLDEAKNYFSIDTLIDSDLEELIDLDTEILIG